MFESKKNMNLESLTPADTEFWIINQEGKKIKRDFAAENKLGFDWISYLEGKFDDLNYMFFENFHCYDDYDCTGSDYERYGCKIEPGDVVVDIGANVGMFTRWARLRGASRVISFEPFSLTYACLIDNSYGQSECHRLAVGEDGIVEIGVPGRISNLGGTTSLGVSGFHREFAAREKCPSMSLPTLFRLNLIPESIDFLKIDCEGAEKQILESLSDEDLLRIRKISIEYHEGALGSETRLAFVERAESLGYSHFTLFQGSGDPIQLHFWANK